MKKLKTFYEILIWTAFVVISTYIAIQIFLTVPKSMLLVDCVAIFGGYTILVIVIIEIIGRYKEIKLKPFMDFTGIKSMSALGLLIGFIIGYITTLIPFHTDLGEIGDRFKFHSTMIMSLFITFYVGWHFEFNEEMEIR